jgi:diguanylate cyclase (GGDEF)-like protein/PAS domain S-box-containing protein
MQLLILALVPFFGADIAFAHLAPKDAYQGGDWPDLLWLGASCVMAFSAQAQYRAAASGAVAEPQADDSEIRAIHWLPYAAILAGYGLLLLTSRDRWETPFGSVVLGVVALTDLVVARQVTAVRENTRLLAENAARRSEARFRSLVQNASDAVIILQPDGKIVYLTPSVERMLGYKLDDLLGQTLLEFVHADDVLGAHLQLEHLGKHVGGNVSISWRLRHRDGAWLHAETIGTNLLDDANVGGLVLNTRDVTERRALEEQLTRQAFHDPLTGLANRALFKDRVEHALQRAKRGASRVVVLFVDVDDFKTVNDSLGHDAGDRLLSAVAECISGCLRTTDTAARLGGDEFAVLLETVHGDGEAEEVAERILDVLRSPLSLDGAEILVSASIGIAEGEAGNSADELLRNADVAMYTAKMAGKSRFSVYRDEMHAAAMRRLALKADLRRAIEKGEFEVYYQPTILLRDGALSGLEALVRWRHPERGIIAPADFIPLAEETGLIVPIGRWVLREACRQARSWQDQFAKFPPIEMNVNISPRQFQDPDLIADVAAALRDSRLQPGFLVLEITEGVLMQEVDATLTRLRALKELGVRLAIDDFGTGYSSLSYLRQFPIDILKIDRSFVRDMHSEHEASALASAIIDLGRALDLQVVAEGIEVEDQFEALRELGCDLGQGYFWSKPVPNPAATQIVAAATDDGVTERADAA